MYNTEAKCRPLIHSIQSLGYKTTVLDGFHNDVYDCVKGSPIEHWICSGGDSYVILESSPQLPMKLFSLKKKFLCICYSMESVIHQLGYPIMKRFENKKEMFNLDVSGNILKVRRNHRWYFKSSVPLRKPLYSIASYNGELMIASYKNALLMQFHPERSADGKKLIMNWIS